MKNRIIRLFLVVITTTLISSCVHDMNRDEFINQVRTHSIETVNSVWYIGSTKTHDYFIHVTTLSTRRVRIPSGEINIGSQFPLTEDQAAWTLIKSNTDLF